MLKKIAIAFAVLAGLVVLNWWNVKRTEEKEAKEEKEKKIVNVKMDEIHQIKIISPTGEAVFERRKKNDKDEFEDRFAPLSNESLSVSEWMITTPFQDLPDFYTFNALIDTLEDLSSEKLINETGKNAEDYNLKNSPIQLFLYGKKKDSPLLEIQIGDENSAGTGLYAKTSESPKIYLIGTSLRYLRDREIQEWRRKEIVGIKDFNKVQHVEVKYPKKGGKPFVLLQKDDRWSLKEPLKLPADKSNVESLLRDVRSIRSQKVISEDGEKELGKYGLKKPAMVVQWKIKEKEVEFEKTVEMGQTFDDGKSVYFRRPDYPYIYSITEDNRKKLSKSWKDFVNRKPIWLERSDTVRLSITKADEQFVLEKKDDVWNFVSPSNLPQPEEDEVSGLMGELFGLRAEKFLDQKTPHKSEKPDIKILVSDGKEENILRFYEGKDEEKVKGVTKNPILRYEFAEGHYDDFKKKVDEFIEKNLNSKKTEDKDEKALAEEEEK